MNRPIETKLRVGFGLVSLLLISVMLVAHDNSEQFRLNSRLANLSHNVLATLEELLGMVLSAETATRGFVLTGDADLVDLFHNVEGKIPQQLLHLRSLTADQPEKRPALDELAALIQDQLRFQHRLVATVENSGREAGRLVMAEGGGERSTAAIRAAVAAFKRDEQRVLIRREREREKADRDAMGVLILLSLMAAALLFSGYRLVHGYLVQRRKAEQALKAARGFAESVVDTVRQPLVVLDRELHVKSANPSFEAMFRSPDVSKTDVSSGEPAGSWWMSPQLEKRLKMVLEADQPVEGHEVEYRTRQGEERTLLVNARRLFRPGNHVEHILVALEDITDRRQRQAEIEALNAKLASRATELETANKELEAFSYSVSHDLRAPLRHISGFSDLLTKHLASSLDEKGRRYLRTISDATRNMGLLIDDLLSFSRMARIEMRWQAVDLNILVQECRHAVQGDVQERNVEWRISPLPVVKGDLPMLRQVMLNLLANALKYTRPRNPAVIEVGCREGPTPEGETGGTVCFVRDNGVGFDMGHVGKLFGVFQRLHRAEEFEGTGIGLANVQRIIRRHGGHIWAEGRLGEGATFFFTLAKEATC